MDASQVIGSAPVATLIVVPKGSGSSVVRSAGAVNLVGGALLPLVMKAGRRGRQAPPSDVVFDTPGFGGYGLLALTATELVLVTGHRNRVHKVIARMPRTEIALAERYGSGFPATAPLVIAFKNGHGWYFEFQWTRRRAVKKILPLLKADEQAALQS
jgi:hypothetical protein